MEAFILHHLPIVFELPHDQLEIFAGFNVSGHDFVELAVQQDLSQQLDGLPFRDIAFGLDQYVVVLFEEQCKVSIDVFGHHGFVLDEDLLRQRQDSHKRHLSKYLP